MVPDPYAVLPPVAVPRPERKIRVDSLLGTLSVEEKVGQLLMPWLLGNFAAYESEEFDTLEYWIDSLQVGGIVISLGSPLDVAAKLNALQQRARVPLLISADLEWGTGMRLSGGTAFPVAMAFGATNRELDAYQLGRVTALEARAVGIHWTFSPVTDLNNDPKNPIINTRSFGEDPEAAARLVAAYVRGAEEHGLFTTAKHFPGHGDTDVDSHAGLPVVSACWDRLDTLELVPFRAAIHAGVTSVMTGHLALPCVDSGVAAPATLSPRIVTGVLRDSLGFKGVVVTDALTMGAIVAGYGAGESAVRALLAGNDVLLVPADLRVARDALVEAVRSGRVAPERLDASVRRVLALKRRAGLYPGRTVPLDSVPAIVGQRAFQAIADDVAARALTLVREGPLPAFRATRGRTAVITYAEESNLSIGNTLIRELRLLGDTVATFRLYPASGPLSYDSARTLVRRYPRTLFAVSVRAIAGRGHVDMPGALAVLVLETDRRSPVALASLGSPYLLTQLPGFCGAYLVAWGDVPATERAVARVLAGGAPVTGRLPITVSERYRRGHGIAVVETPAPSAPPAPSPPRGAGGAGDLPCT
jgi:beta-N-acetylhexosaminidase